MANRNASTNATSTATPPQGFIPLQRINQSNPHFQNGKRSAYELGWLLRGLPTDLDLTSAATPADKRLQFEAAGKHAENYNEILLDGLESLGRVMWSASENEDWPVAQHDVARLGTLISQLAIQLQFLAEFRTSVSDQIAEADEKGNRK